MLCLQGFFASGVHQAVFAIMSTLPYAIGQVQDVGLIFLSAMATSIAALCSNSAEVALGTALTWLAISTVLVGVAIVAVGKYKWATLVQYMPVRLPCLLFTGIVLQLRSLLNRNFGFGTLHIFCSLGYSRAVRFNHVGGLFSMRKGDVSSDNLLTYGSLHEPIQ